MRNSATARIIGLGLVAALGLFGCGGEDHDGEAGDEGSGTPSTAPEFPEGQGQAARPAVAYPAAPYGVSKGSIVANYKFIGYPDSTAELALHEIQLADFHNPTGTETFAADAPFNAGQPKPKALMITVSARWCGPCNLEAGEVLPDKYAEYKPLGGEFLLELADGTTPGEAATTNDLNKWTSKYDVNYPATIDPTEKLGVLFEADAYPANMIIKTSTMEIIDVIAGTPSTGFWNKFEKVLDGEL
jgi:hypothetical protein